MTAPNLSVISVNDQAGLSISVVMPTYNRAELLRKSAQMILNQTRQDLELIISDDHSTDDTRGFAAQLMADDRRVRYLRPDRKGGITHVVNEAIMISRGGYIQICHDHDIYKPTMIEKLSGVLDRNHAVAFVHPGRQGCDYLGNPLPQSYFVCAYPEVSNGKVWRRRMLTRLASPVTGMSMIRRTALEKIGLFDPEFGACSDIDMWMRLCAIGDVGYVNELLLLVRGREPGHPYAGMNWNIQDEVIRAHRKHLRLCYAGISYIFWKWRRELEIDLSLLISYLNSYRHYRWSDVDRGREYLRAHGVFFSRLAGWLL